MLRRPQDLPAYLRLGPWSGRSPLDVGLPWIAFSAIRFLERYLRADMNVCEFGAGGSTRFFSRRCRSVLSIEHDARWIERVRQVLDADGAANVQLRHAPFARSDRVDFRRSGFFSFPIGDRYDVILVDLLDDEFLLRPECFRFAEENLVAPGGIIILDDAWRYPEIHSGHRARRRLEFKSLGPGRPGVTTTDVYFYA